MGPDGPVQSKRSGQAMLLVRPFQQLFDELVFSIAEEGRYLGLGLVKINQTTELIPWLLLKPN